MKKIECLPLAAGVVLCTLAACNPFAPPVTNSGPTGPSAGGSSPEGITYCAGSTYVPWTITPVTTSDDKVSPAVTIISPTRNTTLSASAPVRVEFRLTYWPRTGMNDQVHFVLDDGRVYASTTQPVANGTGLYEFSIGNVAEGWHTIFVFACRNNPHESVKMPSAFAYVRIKVGNPTGSEPVWNPAADATIVFGAPFGLNTDPNVPDRLDFFLLNAPLSAAGMRVAVVIDGIADPHCLSSWQPYSITGLGTGIHPIDLLLVDAQGHPLEGPFQKTHGFINH